MTLRALVVTGGHPFQRAEFVELLDALPGVEWEHVEHPAATERLAPGRVGADVILAYDMPGIRFRQGDLPELVPPPDGLVMGMEGLLAEGQPFVFLHHAIASWPAWPAFAEIVGGRYHYRSAELRGQAWPDSGYRLDIAQTLTVVAPEHPMAKGLPATFELTDESYQCPIFEADVTPIVVTDAPLGDDEHWSTEEAMYGRRDSNAGWHHPPASAYVAWVKRSGRSPVAYVQPGDGPKAYANPHFRRLLLNALHWAASPEARAWAAG